MFSGLVMQPHYCQRYAIVTDAAAVDDEDLAFQVDSID
jgi:hypothetical protein